MIVIVGSGGKLLWEREALWVMSINLLIIFFGLGIVCGSLTGQAAVGSVNIFELYSQIPQFQCLATHGTLF